MTETSYLQWEWLKGDAVVQREVVVKQMCFNTWFVFSFPYLERSVHPHPRFRAPCFILQVGSMSVCIIIFHVIFFCSSAFSFRIDWKLWEVLSCSGMAL
jgi:hypothetical protein